MTISVASLITRTGKTALYNFAINVARALSLPVDSWQVGDPTRSNYHVLSELVDATEGIVVNFIKSRFRTEATGQWLKVKAEQDYDVTVPDATRATCTVVLTNGGGGYYPDIEARSLTLKNSTSGITYTNTTGGTLESGVGETLSITVEADVLGSDGSAAIGEIDEMVTQLDGVTCANTTAAVGTDEQDESVTRQQMLDKLSSLSPNGAKGAYSYVARDPDLAGTSACTRAREFGDTDTGTVTLYCAGPSGGVVEADRALIETAILAYATPLCITPTVVAATNVAVPVTYTMKLYKSANVDADEAEEAIEAALEQLFASPSLNPIGGNIVPPATTGYLYRSLIVTTIQSVYPQAFDVTVSAPSGDTALTNGQVATLGAITATVTLVVDP